MPSSHPNTESSSGTTSASHDPAGSSPTSPTRPSVPQPSGQHSYSPQINDLKAQIEVINKQLVFLTAMSLSFLQHCQHENQSTPQSQNTEQPSSPSQSTTDPSPGPQSASAPESENTDSNKTSSQNDNKHTKRRVLPKPPHLFARLVQPPVWLPGYAPTPQQPMNPPQWQSGQGRYKPKSWRKRTPPRQTSSNHNAYTEDLIDLN